MTLEKKRGLILPWEARASRLRTFLRGTRVRVLLIALFTVVAAWWVLRSADREARLRETRTAIAQVHRAIAIFRAELDRCPRSTDELLHPPVASARHLREIPRDGWGRPLWIHCPGRLDPNQPEVVSAGPSASFFDHDSVY